MTEGSCSELQFSKIWMEFIRWRIRNHCKRREHDMVKINTWEHKIIISSLHNQVLNYMLRKLQKPFYNSEIRRKGFTNYDQLPLIYCGVIWTRPNYPVVIRFGGTLTKFFYCPDVECLPTYEVFQHYLATSLTEQQKHRRDYQRKLG